MSATDVFMVRAAGRDIEVRRRPGSGLVFDALFDAPLPGGPDGFTIAASGHLDTCELDEIARIVAETATTLIEQYPMDTGDV